LTAAVAILQLQNSCFIELQCILSAQLQSEAFAFASSANRVSVVELEILVDRTACWQ
jgi:hypothetical protein